MDIGEHCATCGACVTDELGVTGGLNGLDEAYVIGVLCAICELSATDELFDIVPAIAGLAVIDVGYGVEGGGSGVGGSCDGLVVSTSLACPSLVRQRRADDGTASPSPNP